MQTCRCGIVFKAYPKLFHDTLFEKSVQFYATFMTPAEDTERTQKTFYDLQCQRTNIRRSRAAPDASSKQKVTYYQELKQISQKKSQICACRKSAGTGKPEIDKASVHRILFVSESKISNLLKVETY